MTIFSLFYCNKYTTNMFPFLCESLSLSLSSSVMRYILILCKCIGVSFFWCAFHASTTLRYNQTLFHRSYFPNIISASSSPTPSTPVTSVCVYACYVSHDCIYLCVLSCGGPFHNIVMLFIVRVFL